MPREVTQLFFPTQNDVRLLREDLFERFALSDGIAVNQIWAHFERRIENKREVLSIRCAPGRAPFALLKKSTNKKI